MAQSASGLPIGIQILGRFITRPRWCASHETWRKPDQSRIAMGRMLIQYFQPSNEQCYTSLS
ncbi:hypothetical protein NKI77_33265 [Mesorhizobium opportunistum]